MLFVFSLLYAFLTEKHHQIFSLKKIKWKGGIAQWQSIWLQIKRSPVQLWVPPNWCIKKCICRLNLMSYLAQLIIVCCLWFESQGNTAMLFVLNLLYAVLTEKHHRIFSLKKIKWKGGIAQWQSIWLQIKWSPVQLWVPPNCCIEKCICRLILM